MLIQITRVLICLVISLFSLPARSQEVGNDVPLGHFAYEAVTDLARKGLIKGYPPSGDFFGNRTATRYEMATIIHRISLRIEEMVGKKAEMDVAATKEDLVAVRRLIEEFRIELIVIGSSVQKALEQIAQLQQQIEMLTSDVEAVKQAAERAAQGTEAVKAEVESFKTKFADLQEAFSIGRIEFEQLRSQYRGRRLSGYLQARFEAFEPGKQSLFVDAGTGGTGQTPTTGGPAVGGPKYGGLIRRALLAFGGTLTPRTDWRIQLDVPSTGAVNLKDAFIVLRDLPLPTNFTTRIGLFVPPFGTEYPASSSTRESPERALGFSDSTASSPVFKTSVSPEGGRVTPGTVLPLWLNQDRDLGVVVTYNLPNFDNPVTRISFGAFQGEGRAASGQRNTNRNIDMLVRAQTSLFKAELDLGVSGYYGTLPVRSAPPTGSGSSLQVAPFRDAYRMLLGADVRYHAHWGTTFRAEYMGGLLETTPDRALYLQGNHAQAWYVSFQHPISRRFDIAAKYDEFYPISQRGKTAGGLGRMQLVRKTIQGGLLYYFDDVTRFRLWYLKGLTPFDPSVAQGDRRGRLGFITAEVQVTY